ncbi:unnamed protein product [Ambrosiozyma monospora]|uniref:Unnamed protein product n=1 Tax=Ambrosiozyma monospora TaxID=43982 RepID=A0A9W6YXM9_AMBMO|nr:unnamed protein product [Ambrosiozyma monospora]
MPKLTKLTQDEMDNVIYDARFGDLESLTEIFTDEVEPSVIITIKDEYTLATPIHMAAANGHTEVVKYLLSIIPVKEDAKKLVAQQNDNGNTALHWAALNGHLDVIKLLCEEYDADPFVKNGFEHDSIYEAEKNEKEEVEKYFLEKYDIDDDEEDKDGKAADEEIKYSEGTEIETVTEDSKKAMSELQEKTKDLKV